MAHTDIYYIQFLFALPSSYGLYSALDQGKVKMLHWQLIIYYFNISANFKRSYHGSYVVILKMDE